MSLNRWNCKARVNGSPWIPFGINQLLLRGLILKNTDYVYGIVGYTGHETKAMLNSKEAPHKTSNVLHKMNKILYSLFVFQGLVCISFGFGHFMWDKNGGADHLYLDVSGDPDGSVFVIYVLTFLVAYSHLIPISLYVALEVVKLALAYIMSQDLDMYYEEDDKPAICRTSDLVEELGQVDFVFSDKTGTLT
jgi:phospholipid-transporting ATPase